MKVVKNNTGSAKTWCGMEILSMETYEIQVSELSRWANDSTVLTDLGSGDLLIGDGSSFFSSSSDAINFIKDLVPEDVYVKTMPDPAPFATPSYRTKRNATSAIETCAPGNTVEIQFLLTQERYVHGGSLVIKNPEIGDYIYAEVEDVDGVIPEAYRSALCEAYPVVATYIIKEWVKITGNGYAVHEINTYPLNAKITAGLYLCIHYVATSEGSDRKIGVNYYKTKKL